MLQRLLGHTTLMTTNRYCQAVGCYGAVEAHKKLFGNNVHQNNTYSLKILLNSYGPQLLMSPTGGVGSAWLTL